MGTLFKKKGSKNWHMGVNIGRRQLCQSTHTTKKGIARKLLARWETEVFEGRFHIPTTTPPRFDKWAEDFLETVTHPNTRRRYASSIGKLKSRFASLRLSDVSASVVDEYKKARLREGVENSTINHDLRVLRRMMHLAERKQLIARNPFTQVEFLNQSNQRQPHIVTFDEEERILAVAAPHLRVLVVLILETGMRSHKEALSLRWSDVDFASDCIRVRESKTRAGIRAIPLSARCKAELLRWRNLVGPGFSPFVFPNLRNPSQPMRDVRLSWAKALKLAGVPSFWIYNLRHSHASRLSAAGVSDLFVAQMIGHSTPSILQKYSKAIDEYRRDAVRKMESLRETYELSHSSNPPVPSETFLPN